MNALIFDGGRFVKCMAVTLLAVGVNMLPAGDALAARLAAGSDHTLAIKGDGTVWAWGRNHYGQLGNGSITATAIPLQVSGLTRATSVSASGDVSAAVKSNGTVWVWGSGVSLTPVQVSGLTDAIAVVATYSGKFVALRSDGSVWTWEYSAGVNTVPVRVTGLGNIRAIDRRYHALKADGTVWQWGYSGAAQTVPVRVPGLANVRAIAVGSGHVLVLRSGGTVWGWGSNGHGQLGDGTQTDRITPVQAIGLTNVTSITSTDAGQVSQAVKSDGTVWMWGYNSFGQIRHIENGGATLHTLPVHVPFGYGPGGPPIVSNIEATVGSGHSISLRSDGSALGWGKSNAGQVGTGSFGSNFFFIPATLVVTDF